MPTVARTLSVFVSSTFADQKEECYALQREVFPKVRTICEQQGARFQATDSRWGVREKVTADRWTNDICRTEVERRLPAGLPVQFPASALLQHGCKRLPPAVESS
jgi:hypothetical protein